MASPRSAAGTLVTSCPSMETTPLVGRSSPAIRRSRVDLPQPEGPTNTTNSPSWMSRLTSRMISTEPKFLTILLRDRRLMRALLFETGPGNAGGDEALQEDEDDDHRDHRNHGHGQDIMPLHVEFARVDRETHLQG